ncbi:TetR/AcrR family transcriptional regulator [cf. Phormidesmis sp. LEGE 11477]|uniref:TetR/AcrR family transcriptional regulator n=1 Tax=cf. Phormidesmis sp. LEGE 11477 TaxID=1828680 RepID=UPI001880AA55|nr:TetR/AcrR family transcriptional regulator [cf. Phormidesmis sp. LEGE 11477]MBE9063411.1 TetR/AcrR family transcriptional regulator [cf. Phormidesmis sp. LEGE 11477]
MPKPTFFNLSEKKRQKITDLAISEFASADYDNASISNIVKQAKIAKGSFYQYFEDKKDLYLYLVDSASVQRIDFIEAARKAEKSKQKRDFFRELRWRFGISIQFSLHHPQLTQIINRAAYSDSPVKKEVFQRLQAAYKKPIHDLVERGIANGDLRADLDPDLATFMILTTADNLRYFIPEKLEIDTEALTESAEIVLDMQGVERIFDGLIQVLERGMGSTTA